MKTLENLAKVGYVFRLCENSLFYIFANQVSILAAHKGSGKKVIHFVKRIIKKSCLL